MQKTDIELLVYGLDAYQTAALKTAIYQHPVVYPALKISGEAGECAEKVGKALRDDTSFADPAFREALGKEIGDVLWYCAALAADLGLSLGDVAAGNLAKLADRKARGALKGSGDYR